MKTIEVKQVTIIKVLVLLMILFGIITFFALKDGQSCVDNPFIYGANKNSDAGYPEMQCSCFFNEPNYAPLYFDKNGMSTEVFQSLPNP